MNRRSFFGLIPAAFLAGQARAQNHATMTFVVDADEAIQRSRWYSEIIRRPFYTIGDAAPEAIMPLKRDALVRLGVFKPHESQQSRINPAWDGSIG